MIESFALIFLVGLGIGEIFKKLKLPNIIGMIIAGVLLGPYVLNMIDSSVLEISGDLRKIALIIILIRAGLSLNIEDLKKVGRPAFLMCFIPACFEIMAMVFFAPKLLGISVLDAAIMGSVIAAVSPAIIVPRMIKLMNEGYGVDKSIPQLILAGASVDDVFVVVLFSSLTSLALEEGFAWINIIEIPISILLGFLVGGVFGWLFSILFKKRHIRDTIKVLMILSTAFLFVSIEPIIEDIIPFSGLLAVMSLGIALLKFSPSLAKRISLKFSKLWIPSEIILFVLVGAAVNINYALNAGINTIILIFIVLIMRMIGVFMCTLKTSLNQKERLFCMIAYIPKATVQAAIGSIPLEMGIACGEMILTVSVIAILLTAPLGAIGIDLSYKKLLTRETLS